MEKTVKIQITCIEIQITFQHTNMQITPKNRHIEKLHSLTTIGRSN
jgi:hypothetical protein